MQLNPGWPVTILAVSIFWLVTASIFFGLRVYVRAVKLRRFRSDDYLILLTHLTYIVFSTLQWITVYYGNGERDINISAADDPKARYVSHITQDNRPGMY